MILVRNVVLLEKNLNYMKGAKKVRNISGNKSNTTIKWVL